MRFALIEQICAGGSAQRPNEDAVMFRADAAAALDGATGLADTPLTAAVTDAAWVAAKAALLLQQTPAAPAPDMVRAIIPELVSCFEAERLRAPEARYETPSASLMLAAGGAAAWFGDCRCLAETADGFVSLGPPRDYREKERANAARYQVKGQGHSGDARAMLRRFRSMMNMPGGYGVLAPQPECAGFLQSAPLNVRSGDTALLMSDGFYALAADYEAYDDAGLLAAAVSKGLGALYAELRAIETADPDGARFPRFKTSDDATALLIRCI